MKTINYCIEQLAHNKFVFTTLLDAIEENLLDYTFKNNTWSLRMILCHLCDEEVEDFRSRTLKLLAGDVDLIAFNPEEWPIERKYADQNFQEKLVLFKTERSKSIELLNQHSIENWAKKQTHKRLGSISAKDMLCNWLAHDYLHIRQINRMKRQYFADLADTDLNYAGNW